MIISDLNTLEVISEETTSLNGGGGKLITSIPKLYHLPTADGTAFADAAAVGYSTTTLTNTSIQLLAGSFSHSTSVSFASASGYP